MSASILLVDPASLEQIATMVGADQSVLNRRAAGFVELRGKTFVPVAVEVVSMEPIAVHLREVTECLHAPDLIVKRIKMKFAKSTLVVRSSSGTAPVKNHSRSYQNLEDSWLVIAARSNDREARSELTRRYSPEAFAKAKQSSLTIGNRDDLNAEALIAMQRAFDTWVKKYTLKNFVGHVVENHLKDVAKKIKAGWLLSLDCPLTHASDEDATLGSFSVDPADCWNDDVEFYASLDPYLAEVSKRILQSTSYNPRTRKWTTDWRRVRIGLSLTGGELSRLKEELMEAIANATKCDTRQEGHFEPATALGGTRSHKA